MLTFASNNRGLPSQIAVFLDEVEQLGGGEVQLDYIDGWREGEPEQESGLIEDVRVGAVDMAWIGARGFDSIGVTSFQALVAPFLIDSYDLQDEVFAAGIPMRMLEGVDELELTGIGILPGPLRQMLGINHPFVTPADFEGHFIGTSGGNLAEQTFRALGATPKMVPAEASLDGLDGLDYQLAAIYGNRHYEDATHVTANLNLWPRPLVIVANSDRFAELSDEQQAILRDAAAATVTPASEAGRAEEAEGGNGLCSVAIEVVEISEDERSVLRDAVDAVYEELEADSITSGFLDEIRAVKQRSDAEPELFVCPEPASESEDRSTPLDGVWRMTTTAGELRAAGDPQPIAENYGSLVFVFGHGRFAFTTESDEACLWAYGTYTVDGDRVEMLFVGGGGISPNNAANKPGERFAYGWSRYRDTLKLGPVPGEISPPPLMVKPWRLADDTPSAAVFGTRCPPPTEAIEAVGGSTPDATQLDGTWEISITRDELAAAGASDAELDDPIARGTWHLVLRDGRFRFVDPRSGRTTDSGTYAVDGDELTLTHDADQGGAVFRVRWSLYRDTLRMERIPGVPLAWSGFVADIWHRVD